MCKRIGILLLLLSCYGFSKAQLYGAQWVLGPNPSTLDFRADSIAMVILPNSNFNTTITDADVCDSSGNLLFITNGINIYDHNGNLVPNGNGLSPCAWTNYESSNGMDIPQGALFIPTPGKPNSYHLFHFSNDTNGGTRPGTLYYSVIIDENGSDSVIKKNVIFYKGEFRDGGMTACKHANGRDYWIVIGGLHDSSFYKFLLTPDTILGPFVQSTGPAYLGPLDVAYSKFSLDGSKYVTACYEGLVTVLDFDRCSGEFNNPITIYNEASTDSTISLTGSGGVEFSPNGRFVYIATRLNLNQHDLLGSNIQDSVELYRASDTDYAQIHMLQLAPNGKLYGSTWSGGFWFLHVVNFPDSAGLNCNFVYGGQPTSSANSVCLPNMINYQLGPLIGSGCDTIIPLAIKNLNQNNLLRLIPNPADKYTYVEMGMQGNYQFDLLNAVGQTVDKKQTRQVDIFDTEHLASGIYFIQVTNKTNNQTFTQKLVVQH